MGLAPGDEVQPGEMARRAAETRQREARGEANAADLLPPTRPDKWLLDVVQSAERTVTATGAALDVMTARNDEEWSRWQAERSSAMCRMLWMLARVHAETAERSFRVWLGAAEELKEEE